MKKKKTRPEYYLINDKIKENKTKWKDCVDRIVENRLPKKIKNNWPIRKRFG